MNKGDELRAIRNKVIADTIANIGLVVDEVEARLTTRAYNGLNSFTIDRMLTVASFMGGGGGGGGGRLFEHSTSINDKDIEWSREWTHAPMATFFEPIRKGLEERGLCATECMLSNTFTFSFSFKG